MPPASFTRRALASFDGREALADLASEFKGRIAFFLLSRSTSAFMLSDFSFDSHDTDGNAPPVLGIAPSFDYDSPKFAYRHSLGDVSALRGWLNSFLVGSLRPTFKSAPAPPAPHVPGMVRVMVGDTLEEEVSASSRDILLVFHSPYGFDKTNSTLQRLARVLAPALADEFLVASFDTMTNAFDTSKFSFVDRFVSEPVFVLLLATAEAWPAHRIYSGKPNLRLLLAFLKKHSTSVRTAWAPIKAAVDADNARIVAQRTAVAELQRAEEMRLRAVSSTAKEEVLCCGPERHVVKKVLRPPTIAEAPLPRNGAHIIAHYTGRLASTQAKTSGMLSEEQNVEGSLPLEFDGEVFDSSRKTPFGEVTSEGRDSSVRYGSEPAGNPFHFVLGRQDVIRGWDIGFATMRPGERALLTISPEYGYGSAGSPPRIPPNATLEFDVELVRVQDGDALPGKEEL